MAASSKEVGQLVDIQAILQARAAEQTVAQARHLLAGFDSWYDGRAVGDLAAKIAAAVASGQKVSAQATDAFTTRLGGLLSGKIISAAGQIDVSRLRKGTTLDRAYTRLARDYRYQRSRGTTPERALQIVESRADAMVNTDLQLAARAQAQVSVKKQAFDTYRRVIRPELSKGGSCGMCVVASDRLYHVKDLLPIHDGCHCIVVPASERADYGPELNEGDLARFYADAGGSTQIAALKRTKYKVHMHGELGPVLTNSKYDWRSPKDIAA